MKPCPLKPDPYRTHRSVFNHVTSWNQWSRWSNHDHKTIKLFHSSLGGGDVEDYKKSLHIQQRTINSAWSCAAVSCDLVLCRWDRWVVSTNSVKDWCFCAVSISVFSRQTSERRWQTRRDFFIQSETSDRDCKLIRKVFRVHRLMRTTDGCSSISIQSHFALKPNKSHISFITYSLRS